VEPAESFSLLDLIDEFDRPNDFLVSDLTSLAVLGPSEINGLTVDLLIPYFLTEEMLPFSAGLENLEGVFFTSGVFLIDSEADDNF
jgi:hypothetical protein